MREPETNSKAFERIAISPPEAKVTMDDGLLAAGPLKKGRIGREAVG
jgi:hypothetical protein